MFARSTQHALCLLRKSVTYDGYIFGVQLYLLQRVTPVIVGFFLGRAWENSNQYYNSPPKLSRNCYSVHVIVIVVHVIVIVVHVIVIVVHVIVIVVHVIVIVVHVIVIFVHVIDKRGCTSL